MNLIKYEFYKKELNIKNGKPNRECLKELTTDYLLALFYNLKVIYLSIYLLLKYN